MISNQIPWDLKRTKTNKEENCFVFTLISVFLLKYCTYYIKKNNMYKIQLCKTGNENDILDSLGILSVIMITNQILKLNPLGIKRNQNICFIRSCCVSIIRLKGNDINTLHTTNKQSIPMGIRMIYTELS